MSSESQAQQHVAMPKLMGAPAYARPPRPVEVPQRPPDRDDLPLEAERTPEEQEIAAAIAPSDTSASYRTVRTADDDDGAGEAERQSRSPLARIGLRRG